MERSAQPILGAAGGSRSMIDHQLGHAGALPGREDRDEPVHLAVEAHAFEHPAAVGLERAPEVVQGYSRDARDQSVGEPRRDLAGDEGVVAILPPARDHVVALFELREQPRDVGRIILPVAVDGNDDLAARQIERRRQRRSLAAVSPQKHHANVLGIGPWMACQPRRRAVGRAVVHEDQLVAEAPAVATPRSSSLCSTSTLLDLVEYGNQDREIEVVDGPGSFGTTVCW